jgi:hypothetical protein
MPVTVIKEKSERNDFVADSYHVAFTDKALVKIKEKGQTPLLFEKIARKARIQSDVEIPSVAVIGTVFTADLQALTAAVTEAVKKIPLTVE